MKVQMGKLWNHLLSVTFTVSLDLPLTVICLFMLNFIIPRAVLYLLIERHYL